MLPLLKWVGGKKRVLQALRPLAPWGRFTRYFEPFFGGGAFYFSMLEEGLYEMPPCVLSDENEDLMAFYATVAGNAIAVATNASHFADRHTAVSYLQARDLYNTLTPFRTLSDDVRQLRAGLFLYLNKCGFNGLHRVNSRGDFNTPPNANATWKPTASELYEQLAPAVSALRVAALIPDTFEDVFEAYQPGMGDFIFCDPPYVPKEDGSSFTSYTRDRFSACDLIALGRRLGAIGKRGGLFMLTHRDTPLVRQLFKNYNITEYAAPRSIAADGSKRQPVAELCIRNYE